MQTIKDKTVLITGASSGIGTACAHAFAEQGARLILCARRKKRLDELADALRETHQIEIYTIELDVTQAAQVEQSINQLPQQWQAIDILINNAGLAAGLDKFQDAHLSDWERMIDTNIKGLLYVTKAVIGTMVKRNTGHIINVGSTAGHTVYPKGNVYCASKHAVGAITKGLKLDLHGTQVRVSTVDPGIVETEFYQVRFHGDKKKAGAILDSLTPLSPTDVADAILYCATRPIHVNINEIIMMPTEQGSASAISKK